MLKAQNETPTSEYYADLAEEARELALRLQDEATRAIVLKAAQAFADVAANLDAERR